MIKHAMIFLLIKFSQLLVIILYLHDIGRWSVLLLRYDTVTRLLANGGAALFEPLWQCQITMEMQARASVYNAITLLLWYVWVIAIHPGIE